MDKTTGQLTLDDRFRDAGWSRPGIAFDRCELATRCHRAAVPHGTVFGR